MCLPDTTPKTSGKKIQDAHEAIRPTDLSRTPATVKDSLTREQFRLYQLIWKRFAASQMADAVYETSSVKVDGGKYRFTMSASRVTFDGFMSVYVQDEEKEGDSRLLKGLSKETKLSLKEFESKQHFTQPPAHYTEAALVKTLEELGIGRPSTYAPTITTIIARRYVSKENKNLYLTELGEVVNNMMKQAFPSIVETDFYRKYGRTSGLCGRGNRQLEDGRGELLPGSGKSRGGCGKGTEGSKD